MVFVAVPFLYLSFLEQFATACEAAALAKQCRVIKGAIYAVGFFGLATYTFSLRAPSLFWVPATLVGLALLFLLISTVLLANETFRIKPPVEV